ncbi:MAG: hypothetical protein QOF30_3543 [Acidimicrobiaceae bacterium]|nr:hypothetical protein [Acidimicrobiaceae bacterium]
MTHQHRLAVLGATGFIGSHVAAYGQTVGISVTPVSMPRVHPFSAMTAPIADAADRWRRSNRSTFDDLCLALAPFDVVINAAGDPRAGSSDTQNLLAANAVLPAILARAAHAAGVRRLVHVSTAAVQGRLDPLDETAAHFPLSPYASSKAHGELLLLNADPARGEVPAEMVLYRPTSVQAIRHQATRDFARLMRRLPAVPLEGTGERPVPVAQLENVAAGILFAATMDEPAPLVLQPDEAMTVRHLVELFGARHIVAIPPRAANATLDQLGRVTRHSAYLTSRFRWLELLLRGQGTSAKVLPTAGFTVPVGHDGWVALAQATGAR